MGRGDENPPASIGWRSRVGVWKSRFFRFKSTADTSSTLFSSVFPTPQLNDETRTDIAQEEAWKEAVSKLFLQSNIDNTDKGPTKINHIRQQSTWDCGITCVQMAAVWLNGVNNECNYDRSWMLEQAATESIWTTDLIVILQEILQRNSNFSYLFCSRTLFVHEGLQDVRYYAATFAEDRVRVASRLQLIKKNGWPALQISRLSVYHVVQCIQRHECIAIALLDNQALCPNCATNTNDSYVGHYVVLAGVSNDLEHIHQAVLLDTSTATFTAASTDGHDHSYCLVMHNPGSDETTSYITVSHFERAWRAHGTDEDIVFLVKQNTIDDEL